MVAAVAYGVVHDQITVRLCLAYFSLAHPPLFPVASPTLLALCWGVASTILLGAIFGSLLAVVSQSPNLPPVAFFPLLRGVLRLLAAMACGATLAGLVGFALARRGLVVPPGGLAAAIPPSGHARFVAVWFAHMASYAVGFLGTGIWLNSFWRQRGRPPVLSPLPRSRAARLRVALLFAIIVLVCYVRFVRR